MAVDCSGWVEPLNLECGLVNNFAGSIELFILIAFVVIGMIGTKLRMLNSTVLIMFALFGIIMVRFMQPLLFIVIFIAGLFISWAVARMIKY